MATIFIGLGGSGVKVVTKIREKFGKFDFTRKLIQNNEIIFHGIDIDNPAMDTRESIHFTQVSVPHPRDVIDTHLSSEALFKKWWPEGYYPENALVPGNAAGRHRFNGRLIFWHNFKVIKQALTNSINIALGVSLSGATPGDSHSIYLINSLGGGTGAGMFIDVGFMLREIIANYGVMKLFSVLMHGNIWEDAGYTDSETIALGALTELEKWMEKPQDYDMKFSDFKLPSKLPNGFDKLFDMVFMIERSNLGGRVFNASGTKTIPEQYMEFCSWLLYVLAQKTTAGVIQNVYSMLGEIDEMITKKHLTTRALRFGSAAVSILTVPYDQISDWAMGRIIARFRRGFKESKFVAPGDLLNELSLYEENANQFTAELKKMQSFSNLTEYGHRIATNLDSTRDMSAFFANLQDDRLEELPVIKEKMGVWIADIGRIIPDKKGEFANKLREMISDQLSDSLDFNGALSFLDAFELKLQTQLARVERDFVVEIKSSSAKLQQILKDIVTEIQELPQDGVKFFLKKGKFRELIDEWVARSGFQNSSNKSAYFGAYIGEMLAVKLKEFYLSLQRIVQNEKYLVQNCSYIYDGFIKKSMEREQHYNYDKSSIINVEKLRRNEYPLMLNIPLATQYLNDSVERLLVDEKEDKKEKGKQADLIGRLGSDLWKGKMSHDRELRGVKFYMDQLREDLAGNDGKMRDQIVSNGVASMDQIAKDVLEESISNKMRSDFRVDVALTDYFKRQLAEYKSAPKDSDRQKTFLENLRGQVGPETMGILQRTKISDNEWLKCAINGFFKTVISHVKPFWLFSSSERRRPFMVDRLNAEAPLLFVHEKLDLPLDEITTDIATMERQNINDDFRIFIMSFQFGAPLYLLNSVKNAFHKLYESKAGNMPFSDKRFMNEWKDNIEKPSRFEFSDFIFIMALSFKILAREKKGKAKGKSFYYGDKNLGRITEAMFTIRDKFANSLKEAVKIRILQEVYDVSLPDTAKIEKFNSLLAEAETILLETEPPDTKGNTTARNIWTHLLERVKTTRGPQGIVSSQQGDFYRKSKAELDEIVYEHVGLKL
jgi:hypothetical protein